MPFPPFPLRSHPTGNATTHEAQEVMALFPLFPLPQRSRMRAGVRYVDMGGNSGNSGNNISKTLLSLSLRVPTCVPTAEMAWEHPAPVAMGRPRGNLGAALGLPLDPAPVDCPPTMPPRCGTAERRDATLSEWCRRLSPAAVGVQPRGCRVHARPSRAFCGPRNPLPGSRVLPAGGWSDRGAPSTDIFVRAVVQMGCASERRSALVSNFTTRREVA